MVNGKSRHGFRGPSLSSWQEPFVFEHIHSRSHSTWQIHTHFGDTSFGVYLLVPFLLSILVLLFEISIVEKLPRLTGLIGMLLLLSFIGPKVFGHRHFHSSPLDSMPKRLMKVALPN